MITAPKFACDDDEYVIGIQHRLYGQNVGLLAAEVCRAFLFASRVTNGAPELAIQLERVRERGVDHRILQAVHDQIAGHFRQAQSSSLQSELPLDGKEIQACRVEIAWQEFWAYAVHWICEDAAALRTAAECVATSGSKNDAAKEDLLLGLVSPKFPVTSTFGQPKPWENPPSLSTSTSASSASA